METTQCQPMAAELKLSRAQRWRFLAALYAGELQWLYRALARRPALKPTSSELSPEQEQYLAQNHQEVLQQLEQQRQQLVRNCWPIRKVAFPVLAIFSLVCMLLFAHGAGTVVIVILLLWCWFHLPKHMLDEGILPGYARLNHQFLTYLLPAIGSKYGSFHYQAGQSIALSRFQTRLYFGTRHLNLRIRQTEQANYFHGNYRGCDWELEQVKLYGPHKQKGTTVHFEGHMLILQLPQNFQGITTLNLACPLASAAQVHLEQSRFSDRFRVESTDQVAARAWLTPAVMERLSSISPNSLSPVHAHLEGSSLILLIPGLRFASPLALDTPIASCLAGQPCIQELEQLFALMDTLLGQFSSLPARPEEIK
ncbi:DUF3137 domain-containing protein [Alkalimonas mucilaginosa]|uniref:DUF3137 domain-containing protein n=1 Tax=Alkalimonas mucilaginosa TaxID=3057676 RepID=A0ABU7JJB8_9GAMM|nr:DUF3137 domain-containing protein [Alkalimonas sp. MEB004]MEE2025777.1 DUF3137 domain-containing protein [Alkalimonas sp. MEB004]